MRLISLKHIFILLSVILISSCSIKPDSTEIVDVFDRHSYKQVNIAKLIKQYEQQGFSALSSFDERASYYPKTWLPSVPSKEDEKNNAGIGIILWRNKAQAEVVAVFRDSPAYFAGIRLDKDLYSSVGICGI